MADTTAELSMTAQTNGIITSDLDEDERAKMRPADIDADVREMERRKRVELIMNSKLFREELERIIEVQLRDGSSTSGLMQQISDMMGGVGRSGGGGHSFKHTGGCVLPINDIRGLESMGYAKGEKILRCKLACVYRLIDLYGWTQSASNLITARLNQDEEHFLVNPYGMLFHEITASSLIKADMQGNVVEQGTTNFPVHLPAYSLHAAIHSARPDIRCILHIATPSVVAVSAVRGGLLPLSREAAVIGQISRHAYYGGCDPAEKDRLIQDLGAVNKVLLLTNQGAVCCGETIEEAFYIARNTVLACESQLKLMPIGMDNLLLLTEETCKQLYDAAHRAPENSPRPDLPSILETKVERKWRVGGVEFEALMRMLDNAGFRTGYIYRHPLVKGDPPRPRNDVEVPPAVSSLGYLLEEEDMYKQGLWKKLEGGRKGHDRSRWLNSPNVYQKVEILETGTPDPKKITKWVTDDSPTHSSTPVKIESALQFVPKNTNPKEFKVLQQQLKDYRRADKISAGPQSQILEGVTWEEARKMQDAGVTQTGDHVVLMGAASKGIIQRGYQHNATMYKAPYAKNPFDCVTDEELDEYKKDIERKKRGEYDTDYSESEGLSSAHINKRISDIRSPTSETEEESRDEPQVLRIETKHAPKASRPEVVLSDGLRAVPALTPTATSVNRALYRTNAHYGLPKGRYTQPNPLHFHITRYTSIGTQLKPTFINIQCPKKHFNNSGSFRAFKNDNVSIKIGNSEPISLNLSVRSLREFIYPFANVLNLNLAGPCQNVTQLSSSYATAGSSNDDYVSLTERSCQTSYLVENSDDSSSDFEFNIINNMHDTLVNDVSTNYGEGLGDNDGLVCDYVENAIVGQNENLDIKKSSIYEIINFGKDKCVLDIEDDDFDENIFDMIIDKYSRNDNNANSASKLMLNEESAKSSVILGQKNKKVIKNVVADLEYKDFLMMTHRRSILSDSHNRRNDLLESKNLECLTNLRPIAPIIGKKSKMTSNHSKFLPIQSSGFGQSNLDSNNEIIRGTMDFIDLSDSEISSDAFSDDETLGENEMTVLINKKDPMTVWDRSANGQNYYSTFDVLNLLNFEGANLSLDFKLNYFADVLQNMLIALRDCSAIDLNQTILERRYGKYSAELFDLMVLEDAKSLQVVQIISSKKNSNMPIIKLAQIIPPLVRKNYINKMHLWGNKSLRVNILQNLLDIKMIVQKILDEKYDKSTVVVEILNLLPQVHDRLKQIEEYQKDIFIMTQNETTIDYLKDTLKFLTESECKMPLTIAKSHENSFGLYSMMETFDFLRHFHLKNVTNIAKLIFSINYVRDYLTQRNLVLSHLDVQELTSYLKKVGDNYQVQLANNNQAWFMISTEDFQQFIKPWMNTEQLDVLERDTLLGFFEQAKDWMFQDLDFEEKLVLIESICQEVPEEIFELVPQTNLDNFPQSLEDIFNKSLNYELPSDFEFELNELLKNLEKNDYFEDIFQNFDQPICSNFELTEISVNNNLSNDYEELNQEYSFEEKNYITFLTYHQRIINNLLGKEQNISDDKESDIELIEENNKLLNLELDLEDFSLSDEGLGNSINATKTVTPKSDSVIFYDEVTTKMAEIILTFIKEQSFEIKELIIFPDFLNDVQIQKLLNKLLDLYKNNCNDFSNPQKNELRINIASYCLNRLEMNDSNDSSTNIVSDKVFSISEFISDILDQFFDVVPIASLEVFESPKDTAISTRDKKRILVKTSTPEADETVTAFHIHKRSTSERFWVSIHKSPSGKSPLKTPTPKKAKIVNIDDIPLKLPEDLQNFEQFRFIVNDSEDKEIDLEDNQENSELDTTFKSRLATFEERVKLDNLFNEFQTDLFLPSNKIVSPMPAILEESNRNLFSEDNFSFDSEEEKLKASKVKVNLLNDTINDSFQSGDYLSFDRPEINVIVSSEVDFYRTNTVNTSSFICQSNITFTKEDFDGSRSNELLDSRSNDRDSSLDVIHESEGEISRDNTGDWLGYEKAIF